MGIEVPGRIDGCGERGATSRQSFDGESQESDFVSADEGIGRCAQYGDIVIAVQRDERGGQKAGRPGGWAKQNVGLASAKLAQNVRGSDQVALLVDEEAVAIEEVAIAAIGGSRV